MWLRFTRRRCRGFDKACPELVEGLSRDGAPTVIVVLLEVAVSVKKLFADSGYAGPKLQDALKDLGVSGLIEIVPKPKGAKGFTVLYRRWVVVTTHGPVDTTEPSTSSVSRG